MALSASQLVAVFAALFNALAGKARAAHDRAALFTDRDALSWSQRKEAMTRHGVAGEFGMLIRGAVLLAVGVFVVGAIFSAIPDDQDALSNASTQVEDLTGQAFELAPIVLLVIVAVMILAFVRDL